MIGVLLDGRNLAVRLGHEGLQLLFEELVGSLGGSGLHGSCPLGTVLRTVLILAAFPAGRIVVAAEAALAGSAVPLRLGLQTLDGQINLAVLIADDHDLHILALGQMLPDVADVGIGDLGNMYMPVLFSGREMNAPKLVIDLTLPSKMVPTVNSIVCLLSSI